MKAINLLTINEENRLKIQVQALQGENSKIDRLAENVRKIDEYIKRFGGKATIEISRIEAVE